jgi:hypothetical protein
MHIRKPLLSGFNRTPPEQVTPAAAAPDKCAGMLKILLDYPVSLCTALGACLILDLLLQQLSSTVMMMVLMMMMMLMMMMLVCSS